MGNMSYCRFENTLSDLQDCVENWNDPNISEHEKNNQSELFALCEFINLNLDPEN